VVGTQVLLVANGTCTIAADQAGNNRFFPAPRVVQSFIVLTGSGPAAPADLSAVPVSSARIDLSWTDASHNEKDFRVQRKVQSPEGTWGIWSWIATPPANATGYRDTDLSPDTGYQYKVRACNLATCSDWVISSTVITPGN
jgi:hypothetical protein